VQHVPEEALQAMYADAADSMQQSFAGLMLYDALGDAIDVRCPMQTWPVQPLTSVRVYLQALMAGAA
jgi:hypothetical protein